jgi:hypothetical protein
MVLEFDAGAVAVGLADTALTASLADWFVAAAFAGTHSTLHA